MRSVIMRLLRLKNKSFTRLEDNTDNMQSQDKHRGRLGISQKVLSQAMSSTERLL